MLHGANGFEAVDGELDEGTSHAHDIDELLGVVGDGHGPEATANAAGHDDYLYIVVIVHKAYLKLDTTIIKSKRK